MFKHPRLRWYLLTAMLLLSGSTIGQDRAGLAVTQDRIFAEVGRLHLQLEVLQEYVQTLETRIAKLEAENKALREKMPELKPK
jgi:hypothetical protein